MVVPEEASKLHVKPLLQRQQQVTGEELVAVRHGSKLGEQGHIAVGEGGYQVTRIPSGTGHSYSSQVTEGGETRKGRGEVQQ